MGFAEESGYTPTSIETMMLSIMDNFNEAFDANHTVETFQATNFYKFAYGLLQRVQENEVKTAEIFAKLQQYIKQTNEKISRPVVTNPGMVEKFKAEGFLASIKPTSTEDAGELYLCVDVDNEAEDYEEKKLQICTLLSQCQVGGIVSQGTESESIVLDNSQAFDFKFNLPNRIESLLRLTLTVSENNQNLILPPDDVKNILIKNIADRYSLGRNFEPQKYFGYVDAPWTSKVLLEYSVDGGDNWLSTVFDADYDDLFEIKIENIIVIEE